MTSISEFYREYDLAKSRKVPSKINLAYHQTSARNELMKWFEEEKEGYNGGLLALPTGGGKTFTAIRFLCQGPLSEGYKVLWLAHTHHLLEQAYYSFGPRDIDQINGYEVGLIAEPREKLNVRVVSGTKEHFKVQDIGYNDDVLICTLQSAGSALKRKQPNFNDFLDSAGEKLFVIFDEAHHSPAPTYRNLILNLRERFKKMYLLGLTATPTYTDEVKRGWLKELFPDDIISQVTLKDLMSQNILAKPVFENANTDFEPDFDDREFEKWRTSFQDIPESIIDQLAENRSRNQFIARAYAKNKEKYGKTLIFADRWHQCVQLCEFLRKEGVNAGAMFSQVYQTPTGRIIGGNSNIKTLEKFKNNEIDVLVNIRMLTEGTDVPDVETVFLTRQTTSQILLTQMIGRGLRGPKFGGTSEANIVSFVDNWNQKINWAEWGRLDGEIIDDEPVVKVRPPMILISIDLIRHLSKIMFKNNNIEIGPFLRNLPIGWYQTSFYAKSEDSDYEETNRLVLVFENEKDSFEELINNLKNTDLREYEDEETTIISKSKELSNWANQFFNMKDLITEDLKNNIFYIASHMGQRKERPKFFPFDERKNHDMDILAREYIDLNLSLAQINDYLKKEFENTDRYWKIIYHNYMQFKQHFDACVNRILELKKTMEEPYKNKGEIKNLDDDKKYQVKKKYPKCLSCGEEKKMLLEVDHIKPKYFGGKDDLENLQTLCRYCNTAKNVLEIDFRNNKSPLTEPKNEIKLIDPPQRRIWEDDTWIKYLKRLINIYYCASVVKNVKLGNKEWIVELIEENDPSFIDPYLSELTDKIKISRGQYGLLEPESITIIK
ncbi:MAG: DEAD/DEAH box helicase family protein [Methanomicrobiales archaeon]